VDLLLRKEGVNSGSEEERSRDAMNLCTGLKTLIGF
jgi:hypothetical protein